LDSSRWFGFSTLRSIEERFEPERDYEAEAACRSVEKEGEDFAAFRFGLMVASGIGGAARNFESTASKWGFGTLGIACTE
jgi:hypothetical protein